MGDEIGTCAAAAHASGFPEPDLRKGADHRRRDGRDSRVAGRGGGSPARITLPDRQPSRLPLTVHRFSLASNALLVGSFGHVLLSCYEQRPQKVREFIWESSH